MLLIQPLKIIYEILVTKKNIDDMLNEKKNQDKNTYTLQAQPKKAKREKKLEVNKPPYYTSI